MVWISVIGISQCKLQNVGIEMTARQRYSIRLNWLLDKSPGIFLVFKFTSNGHQN